MKLADQRLPAWRAGAGASSGPRCPRVASGRVAGRDRRRRARARTTKSSSQPVTTPLGDDTVLVAGTALEPHLVEVLAVTARRRPRSPPRLRASRIWRPKLIANPASCTPRTAAVLPSSGAVRAANGLHGSGIAADAIAYVWVDSADVQRAPSPLRHARLRAPPRAPARGRSRRGLQPPRATARPGEIYRPRRRELGKMDASLVDLPEEGPIHPQKPPLQKETIGI